MAEGAISTRTSISRRNDALAFFGQKSTSNAVWSIRLISRSMLWAVDTSKAERNASEPRFKMCQLELLVSLLSSADSRGHIHQDPLAKFSGGSRDLLFSPAFLLATLIEDFDCPKPLGFTSGVELGGVGRGPFPNKTKGVKTLYALKLSMPR